ncbi:hypothetical protein Desde_1088 [Desulfitobacterium dehalogenans ATCC 51507]|uniref:Phage protein n=1 Tax=Desulfitobacterium dehalogenans (strain ATCC 51507 / DSM 9161 / JW/IU-DC1) TaxID=756499 RepID=I4A6D6_DESDJ|nr:hypothetical protein [Desulfitobacterium dehalogenans]AFL99520.1 hypothetical protein Desde_1088 [Desulfitobacterium dehalogenans ATCC 51507]
MGAITFNLVRDSVIAALHLYFPGIDIYGEEIRQGFEEPCFFVKLFPVSQEQLLGRRYKRNHSFDIHYFPTEAGEGEEQRQNEDMHDMAEALYDKMEMVPVTGGLIRGVKMRHEIVDGVLHFFVDYNFHVLREAVPDPPMQTMEPEGFIRG